MIFAHELEDMLYGNSQLVCTEDGENIQQDHLFTWIQPQYKLGMVVNDTKCKLPNSEVRLSTA